MRKIIVIPALLFLSACTPGQQFSRAKKAEAKGDSYKAWQLYQKFTVEHPRDSRAPEALFRAGWLAQTAQGDCYMAQTFYDRVMEKYPQSTPWARLAVQQKNNCPDYFPLAHGWQWVEGDSESMGKNARIEVTCKRPAKKGLGEVAAVGIYTRTYYAGSEKFKSTEYTYKKTATELQEFDSSSDPRSKTILQWPLEAGRRWQTKSGGRIFQYEIVSVDASAKVSAGDFKNCLHIRSSIEGTTGATNEYYAPSIGRVLTTVSTKEGEKRITELLSYKAPPAAEWDFNENTK